jgi:hypothetical protein
MIVWDTIPTWKMPDDCVIQDHTHRVCLKIDFNRKYDSWVFPIHMGDLQEYYIWSLENGIFMEHNLLRQTRDGKRCTVMFVFNSDIDAMAFKLRWQ